ncbi:MAG: hypothetical protein RLZZ480_199 [Candidatus Parcubacteria bacterium]|jgi:hypothetical protein
MQSMIYSFGKILLKISGVILVTWTALFLFEYTKTYMEHQPQAAYEQAPVELKLKSSPRDVLHSVAYEGESGEALVKYAYMADIVAPVANEDINRRTSNSQTEVLAVKEEDGKKIETLRTTFFSGAPQLYEDKTGKWRHVEYATTTAEVFSMSGAIPYIKRRELAEYFSLATPTFADTATYYPDPNTETTSVDGYVAYSSEISFSDARNAADGSLAGSDTTTTFVTSYYISIGYPLYLTFWGIYRAFLLFDTSALPDGTVVSSASLSIYATTIYDQDNDGSDTITVYSSNPASNNDLVVGDYDQFGTTAFSSATDITGMANNAYNTFTLNSSGIAAISTNGVTKFLLMEGHDVSNVSPDFGTQNGVDFSTAEQTGTTQDPKLDVTYTVSSFSMGQWFPF